MIKFYQIIVFLLLSFSINKSFAAFTPGNIVIVRVGDGTATLGNSATAVFLDEYTTTGTLVQSISMPTLISGANKRITLAGTATSEGSINLSADKNYLTIGGYDAALGTTGIASTTAAATNRVIGIIDATGNINSTTALTDAFSANNIRGAVTTDGTNLWTVGSNGSVRFTTVGGTTSTQLSTTIANVRTVSIYQGQLYCSSASGTFQGVSTVGTGIPTTSGQTIALLPGFPTAAGPSSYSFDLKPGTSDILYVADDRSTASGGGVQKWTFDGSTWSLAYTINPSSGARGLTVNWATNPATIYATGSDSKVYKIIDNGSATTATSAVIVTPAANTAIRGVAFAPGLVVLPISLTDFNALKTSTGNLIKWSIADAVNFDHFELERQTEGKSFSPIVNITLTAGTNYSYLDNQTLPTINYYRLKMFDKDGAFSYSKTVAIANTNTGFAISSVYPTITKNAVIVEGFSSTNTILVSSVFNLSGQKILEQTNAASQTFKQNVDFSKLPAGVYILKLSNGDGQKAYKIIKQ